MIRVGCEERCGEAAKVERIALHALAGCGCGAMDVSRNSRMKTELSLLRTWRLGGFALNKTIARGAASEGAGELLLGRKDGGEEIAVTLGAGADVVGGETEGGGVGGAAEFLELGPLEGSGDAGLGRGA